MKEILQQEITTTFADLHRVLSAFKDEQLDTVPFEGSWTAGQVAEHLIKPPPASQSSAPAPKKKQTALQMKKRRASKSSSSTSASK